MEKNIKEFETSKLLLYRLKILIQREIYRFNHNNYIKIIKEKNISDTPLEFMEYLKKEKGLLNDSVNYMGFIQLKLYMEILEKCIDRKGEDIEQIVEETKNNYLKTNEGKRKSGYNLEFAANDNIENLIRDLKSYLISDVNAPKEIKNSFLSNVWDNQDWCINASHPKGQKFLEDYPNLNNEYAKRITKIKLDYKELEYSLSKFYKDSEINDLFVLYDIYFYGLDFFKNEKNYLVKNNINISKNFSKIIDNNNKEINLEDLEDQENKIKAFKECFNQEDNSSFTDSIIKKAIKNRDYYYELNKNINYNYLPEFSNLFLVSCLDKVLDNYILQTIKNDFNYTTKEKPIHEVKESKYTQPSFFDNILDL